MICPKCGSYNTTTLETRDGLKRVVLTGNVIRRRKQCNDCGARWSTVEIETGAFLRIQRAAIMGGQYKP